MIKLLRADHHGAGVSNKKVLSFAEQNFNGFNDNYEFQPPRTYSACASVRF